MRRLFLWCLLTVFASVAHANDDDIVTGSQFSSIYSYDKYPMGGYSCRDLTRSYNHLVNGGQALISEDKYIYSFALSYIDGLAKFVIDQTPPVDDMPKTDELQNTLTVNLITKTMNGCYKLNRMDTSYLKSLMDVIAEGFDNNDLKSRPFTKDFSCSEYADRTHLAIPILVKNEDVTLRVQDGINAMRLFAFIQGYTTLKRPENAALYGVYDKCKQYKNNISFMEALKQVVISIKK